MELEVIPAILVKTRAELLDRISLVKNYVKVIQLDIMDGEFVPNKTIGLEELKDLPSIAPATYEFHWMVKNPGRWIEQMSGNYLHLVHIETLDPQKQTPNSFDVLEKLAKQVGGRLGLAINPETPLEKLLPYVPKVHDILVMSVHPGFSGQKYIVEVEEKITKLRTLYPKLNIEVDGGITLETAASAKASGANIIAAASAIFNASDIGKAIDQLKNVGGASS
ncbi:hypothetical protein HY988_02315 [Candidatus Micrarchaeota archaeon]|nr:hypothetical protein [Candidatus Micrarchaeota archaeon]